MIEVSNIIRQPSLGGFSGVGIRKGVRCIRTGSAWLGYEWIGYDNGTVFADAYGWSEWGTKGVPRPSREWQTLQDEVTLIEYDRGQIYTTRLPAGTRYRLARGGDAYSASKLWVVRPDRKYGPKVVR